MPVPKTFINLALNAELYQRIEAFRIKHGFNSRTEAIRFLITAALDARITPKKGE